MSRSLPYLVLAVLTVLIIPLVVLAADCETNCGSVEECADKIKICQEIWDGVQKAKAPHESALKQMEADIAAFQRRIAAIGQEIKVKEAEIVDEETELGEQQETLAKRVRAAYIRSFTVNPLLLIFSQASA